MTYSGAPSAAQVDREGVTEAVRVNPALHARLAREMKESSGGLSSLRRVASGVPGLSLSVPGARRRGGARRGRSPGRGGRTVNASGPDQRLDPELVNAVDVASTDRAGRCGRAMFPSMRRRHASWRVCSLGSTATRSGPCGSSGRLGSRQGPRRVCLSWRVGWRRSLPTARRARDRSASNHSLPRMNGKGSSSRSVRSRTRMLPAHRSLTTGRVVRRAGGGRSLQPGRYRRPLRRSSRRDWWQGWQRLSRRRVLRGISPRQSRGHRVTKELIRSSEPEGLVGCARRPRVQAPDLPWPPRRCRPA